MTQTNDLIAFGTGGIRGVMGPSSDQINEHTVKRVIQGFSDYLLHSGLVSSRGLTAGSSGSSMDPAVKPRDDTRVVIAYDSRHNSEVFAKVTAGVFAANHIPVFIFNEIETTPMLSFAIRYLDCIGGICITASHNPPEYNGVKVYGSDGAQIVPPQDKIILDYILNIKEDSNIISTEFSIGLKNGLIKYIDPGVHNAYFKVLLKLCDDLYPKKLTEKYTPLALSIVYTPLHGTGYKPAMRILNVLNYKNIFVVSEQEKPDGNFPTVKKPNPEDPKALTLAIKYAEKQNADIVFATDPDSDRLAICVKDTKAAHGIYQNQSSGDYVFLNGNQTGSLLLNFILSSMQKNGMLQSSHHKVIKTIVTSELFERICRSYGVEIFNTPTGFKWIAKLIKQWETDNPDYKFLFGAEESFGYMFANNVRDKDGIAALGCAVQMAAYYKNQNVTLCDALFNLFQKFGAWQEDLMSFDFDSSQSGMQKIDNIMKHFREETPLSFNKIPVVSSIDYLSTSHFVKGHTEFPKLNILQFILADGTQISIRPSGTEPKLKIYFSVCTKHDNVEFALKQTYDKIQCLRYEILSFIQ